MRILIPSLVVLLFASNAKAKEQTWIGHRTEASQEAERLIRETFQKLQESKDPIKSLKSLEDELSKRSNVKSGEPGALTRANAYVNYEATFEPILALDFSKNHLKKTCSDAEHLIFFGESGAETPPEMTEADLSSESQFALKVVRDYCQKAEPKL